VDTDYSTDTVDKTIPVKTFAEQNRESRTRPRHNSKMALSRHHAGITRPLNVQEIVSQAQDFDFNVGRDLRAWLRSAKMLLTEAVLCERDGNLQMAYLYLYRHAELVVGKLPLHPEIKDPQYKNDLKRARQTVNKNLVKLEQWKPRINQEHQRYVKAMERRNAEKQSIHDDHRTSTLPQSFGGDRRGSLAGEEDAYHDLRETLNASEHRQLAVNLAQQELLRRDSTRQSTRKAGISPGTVASRRQGIVVGDLDSNSSSLQDDLDRASDGIQEAGRLLSRRGVESQAARLHDTQDSSVYSYPLVPTRENSIDWNAPQPRARDIDTGYRLPPPLPAKSDLPVQAPPRPAKTSPLPPQRGIDSSKTASQVTFKPSAFTEAGEPLRTVFLPPTLRTAFMNLAHSNTLRNLETCGILCGTLISNALFISHLVIPDQQSTSDTCDTTEEGDNALFDYCDGNDLLVCGWIHTHPSQSCFLSSRDLHTSSGYQVMLPEAIAIVCAPRSNPDWGIFRLTSPPGLPAVLGCHQKGLFHPHAETNLYTDALRPGHVVEGPGLKFETVDLRKS
jgi:STAM-binding protein